MQIAEMHRITFKKFQQKIKKLATPLIDHFGVNHFYHYRHSNEGHYVNIGLNVDLEEYFFSDTAHLIVTPYMRHPKYFKNGISYIQTVKHPEFEKMVGVFKDKYNVHQAMEVINKTEDGLEAYGFGLNSNNLQQHLSFYNATPLIQLFIDRIKEELNPHKAQLEEYQVDIATLIGPDYHKPPVPLMLEPIQYDSFLKHLNLSPSTPLTSRELQVVKHLLDGYPASHIADTLLLSKRTVEHYIDNIKIKFNCIAKSDLIKILRRLESIGYLENHL